MKSLRLLALLPLLVVFSDEAAARFTSPLAAGDAYSRVLCRLESDPGENYLEYLKISIPETATGPVLLCRVQSFTIEERDGKLVRERIRQFSPLRWERWDALPPLNDEALELRRYFVVPEICFHENDTWRCRKMLHVKGEQFIVELDGECPYRVKISGMPVVTTFVTNETVPPLDVQGVQLLEDRLSSNPFSFHPFLDVTGEYYRDLAIVDVVCSQGVCENPPCKRNGPSCATDGPNGRLEAGEACDDGNLINELNGDPNQCRNDCTFCGDGVRQSIADEFCDDGDDIDEPNGTPGQCRSDCTACGDGIQQIEYGEQCDPPGSITRNGVCSDSCTVNLQPFCGDGEIGPGEKCDPGNPAIAPVVPPDPNNPTDACRLATEPGSCTYCGDGKIDTYRDQQNVEIALEACDPGDPTATPPIPPAPDNPPGGCSASCQQSEPEVCRMFRDPSFSRDQSGAPRLKANGRMEAIDTSVAGPNDSPVVDIGTESITVSATTPQDGEVFSRTFLPGSLAFFRDGGNEGWEFGKGTSDEFKLKVKTAHTRFNLELPGGAPMDELLTKVEAGTVHHRRVNFSIHFENADVKCSAETVWECKTTANRGSCNGHLQ